MILKGNMLKLTIPFFWAVQSIWLLSFKSIETFIAAHYIFRYMLFIFSSFRSYNVPFISIL